MPRQRAGRKRASRPAPAVILVTADHAGEQVVTVLPITHSPPGSQPAVELPHATMRRLGLDDARSWVMLTDANRFIWPGPDLRPLVPGNAGSVAYGSLPYALFERIRTQFIAALKSRNARTVPRTE